MLSATRAGNVARELADRARDSFTAQFWNEAAGCLYDVVDGEQPRRAPSGRTRFSPSACIHTMLADERARRVVEVVERELLTPVRPAQSLAARPAVSAPLRRRRLRAGTRAYHQGTVWPWLMGPFITAYVRVNGHQKAAREQAGFWLAGFREHLKTAGLGQVSEILDGDAPHRPGGCCAQAWSVAELLRAAVEDVAIAPGAAAKTQPPSRRVAGKKTLSRIA